MYFQRKCRFCGKVFETKRYPNQFCSQSCYFKSKRAQRNAAKVNAIKQANPELQPVIQDGNGSCQKDQSLHVPILHEGYLRYRHVCEYCGKSFLSPNENVKFCSKSCYRKQIRGLKKDEASTQKLKEKKEIAEYYAEHYKGKSMTYPKTLLLTLFLVEIYL